MMLWAMSGVPVLSPLLLSFKGFLEPQLHPLAIHTREQNQQPQCSTGSHRKRGGGDGKSRHYVSGSCGTGVAHMCW